MVDLIYSVRNIFNDKDQDGCLCQHGASKYLIPSYQRGYKWASDDTGAVTILLNDIKKAFELKKKEYYLQYITIKETKDDKKSTVLELIDGQQRLTTLSILIAVVVNNLAECDSNVYDFANGKLDYAVREKFFQEAIHSDLRKYLAEDWKEPDEFSQDKHYIISAARKINYFINETYKNEEDRLSLFNFVKESVKIIVNVVDRGESERVFSNLNSNKVSLTEAELIKGILLTKVTRGDDKQKRFREITEERMKLGMQWDEMTRWCNSPEVLNFYFNDSKDGLTELMKFALSYKYPHISYGENKSTNDYPLFNCYLDIPNKQEAYLAIVDSYRVLKDLYEDDEIYNLLGYIMSVKRTPFKSCVELIKSEDLSLRLYIEAKNTKKELKVWLLKQAKEHLKIGKKVEDLWYGDDDNDIHNVLLALNVFEPNNKNNVSRRRFDFYSFKKKSWTLEHIFPQSPEGKGHILTDDENEECRELISKIDDDALKEKALSLLKKEFRDDEEKKEVKDALGGVVNTIGNMCLLTLGDNASNGCLFFKDKRINIYKLIAGGSFVPKHTFEVFGKMFLKDPETIKIWTFGDMVEHKQFISRKIEEIINFKFE